jgi:hypothetical protein
MMMLHIVTSAVSHAAVRGSEPGLRMRTGEVPMAPPNDVDEAGDGCRRVDR